MSDFEVIEAVIRRTARYLRARRAWLGFWTGLWAGAWLWLAVLAAYKVFPLPAVALTWAGLMAALAPVTGLLAGALRSLRSVDAARWVDAHGRMQERVTTAVECARGQGAWRDLVIGDAARHAREFNPRTVWPWQIPRVARWTLLVLVLAAGLGFVPEYRSRAHEQRQREAAVIRETGEQLADLVRREIARRPPALETTERALGEVRELADQLTDLKLTRDDALKELSDLTDRLKQQARDLGRDPLLRRMEEAARTPGGKSGEVPELQRQLEALQKQLGQAGANAEALDRLREELGRLQQAAAGLPEGGPEADAARQQLAEAMADLAQKAAELGLSLPDLDAAMQALQAGQIDKFIRDLDLSMIDLEKLAQMAKAMRDLKMQLAEMGKDLAEQLEKGQALPAIATLHRMIRQLETANLPPEALDAILEEVDRAVPAGSEYGEVGEHLKQAVAALRQGQRSDASQSLSDAADELKRLMEQLGDCQSMLAALEGLQLGQMCIGNGMSWSLCQSSMAGFKPGGKPGRGVGTWADEGLWLEENPNTGLWDNSGITQPTMDPRGVSDRGEGQLSEALTPTKVRGQISPGGSMPSVTLRGVSLRGESRVTYETAVTSAQSEAQSALNQERVPRAYQGAVRDYFDDLDQ